MFPPDFRANFDYVFINPQNISKVIKYDDLNSKVNIKYTKNVFTMTQSQLVLDRKKNMYYVKQST